jgi:hypothetical protein
MKSLSAKQSVTIILILIFSINLNAQVKDHVPSKFRGDVNLRFKSNLDGNNVRTTIHSTGVLGAYGGGPDEYSFEFPKNTNRIHIYFIQLWMGGEVQSEDGDKMHVVDLSAYRTDFSGTKSWANEAVPGFSNPDKKSVARSDEPETWPTEAQGGWADKRAEDPTGWAGSWNGFFGRDIFNADLEMYYKASDDLYKQYIDGSTKYYPDSTDNTRGGLGFLIDARAMAWTQILIQDVQFAIYDIKNDGTKRVNKTAFTLWMADLVGGDPDDDEPFIDLQTDIVFFTDGDPRTSTEPWGDDIVGVAAVQLLETPGNQVDGIDNDGDADQHQSLLFEIEGDIDELMPHFVDSDFNPRTIGPGDKVVLIDSSTFERRIIEYPSKDTTVISLGKTFELPAGGTTFIEDTLSDLRDNDLDGLIDERITLHLERYNEISGTEEPVRYINYLAFNVGDTVNRGFIVAGKNKELSYQNVAPMVDESRDDGWDNDNDWDILQDDLGLDGRDSDEDPLISLDTGEKDGLPTSGAGTDSPGEPNIDKTDVSETDLIGLSGAFQFPAGSISNFNDDGQLWRKYMVPGKIDVQRKPGESDFNITSGYFNIEPGERQRIAVSISLADGGSNNPENIIQNAEKQRQAKIAYDSDYRFATAPIQVTVTAVPGDRKVTLYWDNLAESSIDNFIRRQGGDPEDFEGYRIYRSTDASFLDPKVITDGKGAPLLLKPIKIFDKKDGIEGFHQVPILGVQYYLGDDSGIKHSFVDSNLVNGQRYFYAVTAFDFGFIAGNISPTETAIRLDVDTQGNIKTGTNIAIVTPRRPVAGYVPAEVKSFEHISGSSTADIGFEVVDPRAVKDGHVYEMTFEDTLIRGKVLDVLTTKNFTIEDLTSGDTLINKNEQLAFGEELPLIDGLRLTLRNEDKVKINKDLSGWSDEKVFNYQFSPVQFLNIKGVQKPSDYEIVIGEVGIATSKDTTIGSVPLPAKDVNIKIFNVSENKNVEFAFGELDGTDGRFTIDSTNANLTDIVFLLEDNGRGKLIYTWQLLLNTLPIDGRNPRAGDTLSLNLIKPFLQSDIYWFKMSGEKEDRSAAKSSLKNIRVVPNPYLAVSALESQRTSTTGRAPRKIRFINLPSKCTVRIFTVNGELVQKLDFDSGVENSTEVNGLEDGDDTGANNGTLYWNMLSKDNLEIAYGVYIYHVKAPGIGEKTGTFAIIK